MDFAELGIRVDTKELEGATRALDRYQSEASQTEASTNRLTASNKKAEKSLKSMRSGLVGAASAAAAASLGLVSAFRGSEALYDEQARSEAKVTKAIEATGSAAGKTADELFKQASALQGISRFGDEQILNKVTAQLLTFKNIAGSSFDRAQVAALDLATVLDGDLQSASIMLGKALNDPVQGISAMSRAGVTFTKDQQAVIKALAETGDIAGAQKLILDEIASAYGGQAEAARVAGAGISEAWGNTWGDVKEQVGAVTLDLKKDLFPALEGMAQRFMDLEPATKRAIVVTGVLGAVLPPVVAGFALVAATVGAAIVPIVAIGAAAATAVAAGVALYQNWDQIAERFPGIAGALEAVGGAATSVIGGALEVAKISGAALLEQVELMAVGVDAILRGDYSAAWGAAKDIVQSHKDAVIGSVAAINEALGGWPAAILQTAVEMASNFSSGITGMAAAARAAMAEVGSAIAAEVMGWPSDMVQVGRDLIGGLIKGIKESAGGVKATLSDMATNAIKSAKSMFGIQSPSKRFTEIGEYLIDGLVVGIDGKTSNLTTALEEMAGSGIGATETAMAGFQNIFDGVLDGTVDSWGDALDMMLDQFKNWLSQAIFAGKSNPIQIGASMLGGGGGAGVAQSGTGILGAASSLIGSSGGTGILGGATGLIQNTMSNGLGGAFGYIKTAVSGATSGLAGLGTALGAVAVPLGIAGLAFAAFQKKTEVVAEKMKLNADGLDTRLREMTTTETSRFFGMSKSKSTSKKDASDPAFDDAVSAIQDSVLDMADTLNVASDAFANFSYKTKWSIAGLTDEQAAQRLGVELEAYGSALASHALNVAIAAEGLRGQLGGGWTTLQRDGELAADVIERLTGNLGGVNAMFDYMNKALYDGSLTGAIAADHLVEMFGTLDTFNSSMTAYLSGFYSDAERLAFLTGQLSESMADLNIAMPTTKEAFRSLVDAQDLATESGRETYAALVQLSSAFAEVTAGANTLSSDLVGAFSDLGSALSDLSAEAAANKSAAQSAADAWERAADTLRDYARGLTAEYSTSASYAAASGAYQANLLQAQAGDVGAAGDFTGLADAMLAAGKSNAASGAEYAYLVKRTQNDTERLADTADAQMTVEEQMVALYQEQITYLEQIQSFADYANSLSADQIAALGGMGEVLGAIDLAMGGFQIGLDAVSAALAAPLSVDFAALQASLAQSLHPAALFGDFGNVLTAKLQTPMDKVTAALNALRSVVAVEVAMMAKANKVDNPLIAKAAPAVVNNTSEIAKLNAQLAGLDLGNVAALAQAYKDARAKDNPGVNIGRQTISGTATDAAKKRLWDAEAEERKAQKLREQIAALGGVPSYASGTINHPGGMAMVHGPELVNLPSGSNVTSVSDTKAMFGSLVRELAALRKEMRALDSRNALLLQNIASNTKTSAKNSNEISINGVKVYS